ncbi:hypothetical protein K502DRAFT_345357 [Neoconidiobolus thromboides FSU 785]|nr:hypothetical protein K502DRAFT_345357 [Neoconidiobolus thromboides FSU 785]
MIPLIAFGAGIDPPTSDTTPADSVPASDCQINVIVAHGSTNCAILNKVDDEISLIVNSNENKIKGTFTVDVYVAEFKRVINNGWEAVPKV